MPPNHLSRAARLAAASLLIASCAVGAGLDETQQLMGPVTADAGLDDAGGTGETGGPGAPGMTGGVAPPDGGTGGPGGPQTGGSPGGDGALPAGARNPTLPTPSGPCPEFVMGEAQFTPSGESARRVQLWSGEGSGGPLVIYWHSTAGTPNEAAVALSGAIEQITGAGGVVAAPFAGAGEGMYPWVNTVPVSLKVADEIVACAVMKKGVNPARIHTLGYSAGGLMAGSLAVQRSSYVASMAAYSGGQTGTARGAFQDPTNKLSGILFHGGAMDSAGGTMFPTAAAQYAMTLRGNGGAAILCNHNMGRVMPPDGAPAVLRFFEDHPYGRVSPYAAGLPQGFPAYCQLQP